MPRADKLVKQVDGPSCDTAHIFFIVEGVTIDELASVHCQSLYFVQIHSFKVLCFTCDQKLFNIVTAMTVFMF